MKSPWTDEAVELMTNLYVNTKLSHAEIADEIWQRLRIPVTRNSVIGKVHRGGIVEKRPQSARGFSPVKKDRAGRRRNGATRKTVKSIVSRCATAVPIDYPPSSFDDNDIPVAQRVYSVMALESHHCRWPVGDPGTPSFFFCGGTKMEGCSYCETHYEKSCNRRAPLTLSEAERARRRRQTLLFFGAGASYATATESDAA